MKLRLAATPNTLLHVGQARILLANWLLARRHGAAVLLRLDDADPARTRPGVADAIEHDLSWLGLDWDERSEQSARLARYAEAASALEASGRLYPCFESQEELNAKREQRQRQGKSPIYDRAMLKLTPAQRASAEANGKSPYWRFKLGPVDATWNDALHGRTRIKLTATSDPILIRADGTFLPLFTTAIDDLDHGITHIVRDQDLATPTGLQLDIMAALDTRATIRFAHLPPLLQPDGERLAKRAAALSLRTLRTDGIEPSALATYLAQPNAPATTPEPPARLAPAYDPARLSRAHTRFDMRALLALNRSALAATPFEAVQNRLPPAATPAFWHAVRNDLDLLREARGWWDVVAGDIIPPLLEHESDFLETALDRLPPEPWDAATWPQWTLALRQATARKGKPLYLPLRLALTGEENGPDLATLLPLIGRPRVIERLKRAAT